MGSGPGIRGNDSFNCVTTTSSEMCDSLCMWNMSFVMVQRFKVSLATVFVIFGFPKCDTFTNVRYYQSSIR